MHAVDDEERLLWASAFSAKFDRMKRLQEARHKLDELVDWSRRREMSSQLFFTNLPYDCSDGELKEWIELSGATVESVRIIRDLVSGVSPAFAYARLNNHTFIDEAACSLNGRKMRNQVISVQRMSGPQFSPSVLCRRAS
jgi:RNA recognition motif-containing protein